MSHRFWSHTITPSDVGVFFFLFFFQRTSKKAVKATIAENLTSCTSGLENMFYDLKDKTFSVYTAHKGFVIDHWLLRWGP